MPLDRDCRVVRYPYPSLCLMRGFDGRPLQRIIYGNNDQRS